MKTFLAATMLVVLGHLPWQDQVPLATVELRGLLPPDAKVEQFALTTDRQRAYYTTPSGDVWLYDRASLKTTQIVSGIVWDLAVSPLRDALVFTKAGDVRQEQYVWMLRLDPKSGLPAGTERRVSARSGDVPSFSPDGRWIAFARDEASGVAQSVVVTPVTGGAERVVADKLPSSIGNIRWTPDGRTVYFGVNPPVPFTCAESCLSVPGGNPSVPGAIRRVAVDGGPVEVVTDTASPLPGLSPDGTTLVFADPGGNRKFVVADRNGRPLNTFTLPATQSPQGWAGDATLLVLTSGVVRRLRSVSLDGRSRTLFEHDGFALEPVWLPDGKTMSVMHASGDHCELRVLDPDGAVRKTVALPQGCGSPAAWTADQRTYLYTRYPQNSAPVITGVDVASAQQTELHAARAGEPAWVLDAGSLIVSEISDPSESPRRVQFWRVALDGTHTLLRELPFDEPSGSAAAPIDGTKAMIVRAGPSPVVRLVPLSGPGPETTLAPTRAGYVLPRPTISADKQWVALRVNPTSTDAVRLNRVELIRLDGTVRHTVDLPFSVQGQNTLAIMPGARQLIVSERPSPNTDPGVYLVDVATQSTKKLFQYVARGRFPELVVSPDGATLLALTTDAVAPSVSAMDLSRIR